MMDPNHSCGGGSCGGDARRRARERRRRARKERVLHTRIPALLEEDLKSAAERLRVPVSNLVRTILEDPEYDFLSASIDPAQFLRYRDRDGGVTFSMSLGEQSRPGALARALEEVTR